MFYQVNSAFSLSIILSRCFLHQAKLAGVVAAAAEIDLVN